MSNKEDGCFAAIVIMLIGIPLSAVLYAWAAMLNWNWFATTLGAPHVGFWQAYGLGLVISSLTASHKADTNDERGVGEIALAMFVYIIVRFGMLAGTGWLIHSLMVG
jgi:hypothetical protein